MEDPGEEVEAGRRYRGIHTEKRYAESYGRHSVGM